jgi:hypothetical protein
VLFVLVSLALGTSAWAQGTTNTNTTGGTNTAGGTNSLATNDSGTIDDTNGGSAGKIRENYFKRYPFARDAFKHDKLQTVSAAAAANTGGNPNKDTNARDSVTGAQGNTSGTNTTTNTGSEGEQTNLKMSKLNTTATTTKVLAYDMMVLPLYGVGHWLPGAEPWKQPQYVTQADIPIYIQPTKMYGMDKPLTMRDNELFDNTLTTFGLPISDTQYQLINRENNQRFLELLFDPERVLWLATNTSQMQGACAANSIGASAEAAYGTAANNIINGPGGGGGGGGGGAAGGAPVGALINIANENSGVPTASDNPNKTIPQAVWMVQKMYREVFVPLAILFLLPGAVISQVKMQIAQGMGQSGAIKNDDPPSPFDGILRSVVAVFLIPATQLIVSYSIDTGNSMAYSVKDWVSLNLIIDWAHQLSYNPPPGNVDNGIINPGTNANGTAAGGGTSGSSSSSNGFFSGLGSDLSFIPGAQSIGNAIQGVFNMLTNPGAGGDGLGANVTEGNTIVERQLWLSQIMQVAFNMAMYLFSTAVITLGAYQLIFMCYLYLLGPLAAAFFAWPSIAGSNQSLFRGTFANWLNAVITVSLWRFYWMVILAIMTQRILYLQDTGGGLDLQWEVAVFTCLLGLMMFVPFNPWVFDPATAFNAATQSGSALMSGTSQGANGQQGGIAGALGNAAIAGGANPSAVQQAQGSIANITNQMGSVGMNSQQIREAALGYGPGGQYMGNDSASPSGTSGTQQPPPLSPGASPAVQSSTTAAGGGTTQAPPMQTASLNNDSANMSVANAAFQNTAVSVQPQGQSGTLPVEQPNAMTAFVNPSSSGSQVQNSLTSQGYGGNNDGGQGGGTGGGTTQMASNNSSATTNVNNDSTTNNDSSAGETRLADNSSPPRAFPPQGDDGSFAV